MKYKNHVIFGGQGFIGNNLSEKLSELDGKFVFSIDKNIWNIGFSETLQQRNNFKFRSYDINEKISEIIADLQDCNFDNEDTLVWHLAANSDIQAGNASIEIDLTDTFMSTVNIIEILRQLGLKNIAFASSSAVYGSWARSNPYSEEQKTMPISNYGAMKLASEACLSVAHDEFLKDVTIFRFPNVIGYPATHGVIKDLIYKLKNNTNILNVLGNGKQNKPYLYVDDLINAMFLIVDHHAKENALNIYNIASSHPNVYVHEIAQMVVSMVNPDAEIHYGKTKGGWRGDVAEVHFDTSKIQSLGWKCSTTGHEAVQKTIEMILARDYQ